MRRSTFAVGAILTAGLLAPPVQAAPGDLDPGFGSGGRVTTDFAGAPDGAHAVVVQPDGKIIAGGFTDGFFLNFALVRYNSDGSLDSTFGTGGKVSTPFPDDFAFLDALALQRDGKIVAAGSTFSDKFALARYDRDGTLDASFGSGGLVTTAFSSQDHATAVAVQSDGKIVVGGLAAGATYQDFALLRYNSDGTLDSSFGTGGTVLSDFGAIDNANALAIQPDGKIIAAGFTNGVSTIAADFALARYNPTGSLDSSFGSAGFVTTDFPVDSPASDVVNALVLQPDGRIIAAGFSFPQHFSATGPAFALARYDSSGTLDLGFGTGGEVTTDFGGGFSDDEANAAVLQADGKIVLGGFTGIPAFPTTVQDFALARYNSNGSTDTGFGSNGTVSTDFAGAVDTVRGLALQPDNEIVAAGITSFAASGGDENFALARYLGGASRFFYLRGRGAIANPPTLTLDDTAPSDTTAKFKDSTSISYSGGNPWKEIGTWAAAPAGSAQTLSGVSGLLAFLGLKNSDDQGTQFDLRAEIFRNGILAGSSATLCITGVTRNPDSAKVVTAVLDPFAPVPVAVGDVLSLKLSTRIGTNPDGSKCSGPGGSHSSALGLRVYFDAVSRSARFKATFAP